MIRGYFSDVEKKLEECKWLIMKKSIEFSLVSEEMGIIKCKIVFVNNYSLDFRELVSAEHTGYRFHFIEKFGLKNVFGFDSDFERLGHTVR